VAASTSTTVLSAGSVIQAPALVKAMACGAPKGPGLDLCPDELLSAHAVETLTRISQ
jgi:phosphoglycerate dehydrogenase-like enzyme